MGKEYSTGILFDLSNGGEGTVRFLEGIWSPQRACPQSSFISDLQYVDDLCKVSNILSTILFEDDMSFFPFKQYYIREGFQSNSIQTAFLNNLSQQWTGNSITSACGWKQTLPFKMKTNKLSTFRQLKKNQDELQRCKGDDWWLRNVFVPVC